MSTLFIDLRSRRWRTAGGVCQARVRGETPRHAPRPTPGLTHGIDFVKVAGQEVCIQLALHGRHEARHAPGERTRGREGKRDTRFGPACAKRVAAAPVQVHPGHPPPAHRVILGGISSRSAVAFILRSMRGSRYACRRRMYACASSSSSSCSPSAPAPLAPGVGSGSACRGGQGGGAERQHWCAAFQQGVGWQGSLLPAHTPECAAPPRQS